MEFFAGLSTHSFPPKQARTHQGNLRRRPANQKNRNKLERPATMALLNKADIFAVEDTHTEEVEVKEWGGSVLIKTLTAYERDAFETAIAGSGKKPNLANFRAKYVSKCVVDESGNRLFTEGDLEKLGKKSAKAIDRVYSAAQKLNAMSNEDVSELVEDFDETPDENSTSA